MKQSRTHSLSESLNTALIAAPTAILLHKFTLIIAGENAININQDYFIIITWVMFMSHGVMWKYITRRIHEYYGYKLDPKHIVKSIIRSIYNRVKILHNVEKE